MANNNLAVVAVGIVALIFALARRGSGEMGPVERFNQGDLTFDETLAAIRAQNEGVTSPTVTETGDIDPESGTAGTVIVDPDPDESGDEIHIENPFGPAPPGSEGL